MHDTKSTKLVRLTLLPIVAATLSIGAHGHTSSSPDSQRAAKSASPGMAVPSKNYRGLRASQVIGISVRNEQGNNIGQISDMIVDMNTGDVRYAILRFDPGIHQGEKLFAVPTPPSYAWRRTQRLHRNEVLEPERPGLGRRNR